jgi:tetratricopeptide (TPR) repeat protein
MNRILHLRLLGVLALSLSLVAVAQGQEPAKDKEAKEAPVRGSLVEDRAAKKLLEAGDARFQTEEFPKAVELWQSVIERYPRSRYRFDAHMRLGSLFLEKERAYDRARVHFQAVAAEENREEEQRAEATLKMGICFYEARNYGKCFQIMRDVIEKFPVSKQVNQAYYYIGLGHFQLGHYSRAIDALQKVGTAFSGEDDKIEKVEAGKRLFVKIEDADLSALESGETVKVHCKTTQGDEEDVVCYSVGRNVRVALGSIVTQLGRPRPGNGRLEVRGDDKVEVTYIDAHTSDRQFNRKLLRTIEVVGNGIVTATDGAFKEALQGTVLGRQLNVQIIDADKDLTDKPDAVKAIVAVFREKSQAEIDDETAKAAAKRLAEGKKEGAPKEGAAADTDEIKIDRYKEIDRVEVTLAEAKIESRLPGLSGQAAEKPATPPDSTKEPAAKEPAIKAETTPAKTEAATAATDKPAKKDETEKDDSIHSGVFRAVLALSKAEKPVAGDAVLQGLPGDVVRIMYVDERHKGKGPRSLIAEVKCVEGDLGVLRVTRTEISDQELLVKTKLKTASALTNIGNRYKDFGLKKNADAKYEEALQVCEEITDLAQKLGGRMLEETYVQLWRIYYQMDRLTLAAAMAQRLQREFPNSAYVDDALLQLAEVSRKQQDFTRAIGIYQQLVAMPKSQLRGEAQFGVALCYEEMAKSQTGTGSVQLYDRAFQEYKKVFDQFPDSGRVGEAVAKMANYYYQQKDYARAVDTFETVLNDHPDAQYLDVILFNYGRCLIQMNRHGDAKQRFDQLIANYPESTLADVSKKISEKLAKSPAPATAGNGEKANEKSSGGSGEKQ